MKIRNLPVKTVEKISGIKLSLTPKQKLKKPKKIAVIITYPLGNGDLVGAFPFLKSLREAYSDAIIHLITDMDFFDDLETVDKLIHLPGTFETGKPKLFVKKVINGFKKLRKENYDLAIIPERAVNQQLYLKLLKPKQYVGYFSGYKIEGNIVMKKVPNWKKTDHFWDMSLKIIDALGKKRIEQLTAPKFSKKTKDKVNKIFSEIKTNKKIIAINPHVNWESRRWDENNYVKLVEELHHKYEFVVYDAIYTKKWPNYIQKKLAKKGIKVHNIAGRVNIAEAYYFLTKVDMLVTSDCGPMHYAFSLDTPTVSFFGPVEPWNRLPKNYKKTKIHYAFWYNDYANGGLYNYESAHDEKGMNGLKAIPVKEVIKKINEFFDKKQFSYDDKIAHPINCPLCSKNDFKLIHEYNNLEGLYNLVECKNCSLNFINPLPSKHRLKIYYNKEYGVPIYQQKKVLEKGKTVISELKKQKIKGKLFELGASHGFFLNQARNAGYQVFGVELSTKATQNAKKKFNIEIENNTFEESKLSKKTDYDTAVMFDLLEHLTNPNEVLTGLNKMLKKGGVLALTVPNIKSYEFKLFGKHWEWLSPPAHLFYYSPKTIKKILLKNGFKSVKIITDRGDSAGNLFFHSYLGLKSLAVSTLIKLGKKEELVNLRDKISKSQRTTQKEEFIGIDGIIYKTSELIGKPLKSLTNYRNRKGKGPTIIAFAKK